MIATGKAAQMTDLSCRSIKCQSEPLFDKVDGSNRNLDHPEPCPQLVDADNLASHSRSGVVASWPGAEAPSSSGSECRVDGRQSVLARQRVGPSTLASSVEEPHDPNGWAVPRHARLHLRRRHRSDFDRRVVVRGRAGSEGFAFDRPSPRSAGQSMTSAPRSAATP